MINYDIDRARQAVEYLVKTPYYPHRVKGLRSAVKKPRSLPYNGDEEVLNELLVIGRQSLQALENLIAVAAFKRDTDRNRYQREYMAAMRERIKLAVQLEERRIGKKMTVDQRNQFAHEVQANWNEERAEYLQRRAVTFSQQFGGEPNHEDRNAFIEQFWQNKRAELVSMLAEPAGAPDHNLRKRKRVVEVHKPETAMGFALKKAVDGSK